MSAAILILIEETPSGLFDISCSKQCVRLTETERRAADAIEAVIKFVTSEEKTPQGED
ncbi:MAG: hypothetical protein IJS32_02555 [Kiritimatiellae bacterium]|nr:hypothetical protein [Kiritimatiellia bacterium]